MGRPYVQAATFRVEDAQGIAISNREAERLAEVLQSAEQPDATAAAEKIAEATRLGGRGIVVLGISEDEAVLAALVRLRASGDFVSSLDRLERALRQKIERET